MKGYAAPLLLAFICSACATAEPLPAKARYVAFEKALTGSEDASPFGRYLSNRIMAIHEKAETDEELASLRNQGAFPLWLKEETTFHERRTDNGRCLTVSGTTFDGEPGYMAVRFITEDGALRADDIHYNYPETADDFPSKAICPDEITLSFPGSDDT
ncbi:hypothetical protein CK501_11365 [Halovibrio salipaludis]|uniref:Uncharacterized protein n=1 Tax=Halovibrio salipaludis TaxID=2032626 RepID=A0A2A2F4Z9_9GAMM|nr:hypothetical protein [Halovibrio salipaludis]PAU79794.1 hypothetical protein CK501_11365 [Halovibrio salipaludis]